jgi:solute carrier family 25 phosphate transporter 3
MPLLPSAQAIQAAFFPSNPIAPFASQKQAPAPSRYRAREELYPVWSAVDDAKAKAAKLGDTATKEFEKASSAAQAKAGKIELYSAKYYAACTFGGLMACVREFSY